MSDMISQSATRPADTIRSREDNALLAALSFEALSLLRRHLSRRTFAKGTLLWDTEEPAGQVYFPHAGLVSISVLDERHCIEVGSIGPEGAAGLHPGVAGTPMLTRATVQIGGVFSVIAMRPFAEAVRQSDEVATLAALACEWPLRQAQQLASCNAIHSADMRLARWLLLAAMRTGSDQLTITQEELAGMLGIRRTTATLIAQKLHQAGAIGYSRGKIAIGDRNALQAAACPCCTALGKARWPSTRLAARGAAPAVAR